MSATKKPRADSKLKTLPEDRQAAIYEFAMGGKTLAETVKWLADDGLKTSSAALSGFLSWYGLQRQLEQNESTVEQALEDLKKNDPSLSQAQLDKAGNFFFSALAIQEKDSLMWKRTKDAQTKQDVVRQNEIKLQRDTCELFLKWIASEEAKKIASSSSSNSDKIERLGELMFGEDWK
jgi:hypothetical protein